MVVFGISMTVASGRNFRQRIRIFGKKKLTANKKRDAHIAEELAELGWRVLVIWECELKNREALCEYIRQCLPNERKYSLAPHMGESHR